MSSAQSPSHSRFKPSPVTLIQLREHFKQKYKLNETQVEIMVVSSTKSLEEGLGNLAGAFSRHESVERLAACLHALKGLLLNMGELQWAAYTREIENKLLAGERVDQSIVAILRDGMTEVLTYPG